MAFNIFERWPWTSFQNLNLDWLMKAVKEAITKADEAASNVGQFDARITANADAIEQLSDDVERISSPVHVLVSAELEARYRGQMVTGAQLLTMMQTHGDLPYVEYNGEIYMLDTPDSTGDLRFSMAHTTLIGDVTLRHITIFAASSNVGYSVTNIDGGSGSSDVLTVTITDRGDNATPQYICDHTYAEILSQIEAGKTLLVRAIVAGDTSAYAISGMVVKETTVVGGQTMGVLRIIDPNMIHPAGAFSMYAWYIYENNTVGHGIIHENIATQAAVSAWVNDGDTDALLKTAQTLTTEEQAQVKQNLNITDGGSTPRTVIAADSLNIPPLSPNTLYVFTGDAAALDITLAAPASNVANEYHFIFNSGAAATTLTVPSDIRWPDGFTVEANHVYEVSILENNMTAQGWAVSA